MVEDSPVERVTADRSRHPASLRHSPDFFLGALLLLYRHGLRVSRPRSGRLYFQVATTGSPKAVRPLQVICDCRPACVAGATC